MGKKRLIFLLLFLIVIPISYSLPNLFITKDVLGNIVVSATMPESCVAPQVSPFEYIMEITKDNDKIPKGIYFIDIKDFIIQIGNVFTVLVYNSKGDITLNLRFFGNDEAAPMFKEFGAEANPVGILLLNQQLSDNNIKKIDGKVFLIDETQIGHIVKNNKKAIPERTKKPYLDVWMYGKTVPIFGTYDTFIEQDKTVKVDIEHIALYVNTEPGVTVAVDCNGRKYSPEINSELFSKVLTPSYIGYVLVGNCFQEGVNRIQVSVTDLWGNTVVEDKVLDFSPQTSEIQDIHLFLFGEESQKVDKSLLNQVAEKMHELNKYITNDANDIKTFIVSSIGQTICNGAFSESKFSLTSYCFNNMPRVLDTITHEMAHAVFSKENTKDDIKWEKISNEYQNLGYGLGIDLLQDCNFLSYYCDIKPGHPLDNYNELHSSAFMAYYNYGDKFVNLIKSVKDPALRQEPFKSMLDPITDQSKLDAIEKNLKDIWDWMKENRFNGQEFTSTN